MKTPEFKLRLIPLMAALVVVLIGWRIAERWKQSESRDPEKQGYQIETASLQRQLESWKDRNFDPKSYTVTFFGPGIDQMRSEFERTKQGVIRYDNEEIQKLESRIYAIDHPRIVWLEVAFDCAIIAIFVVTAFGIVIWMRRMKAAGHPIFTRRDRFWLATLLFCLAIEAAVFLWQQSSIRAERDKFRDDYKKYSIEYWGMLKKADR